jgi:hypothetical protein
MAETVNSSRVRDDINLRINQRTQRPWQQDPILNDGQTGTNPAEQAADEAASQQMYSLLPGFQQQAEAAGDANAAYADNLPPVAQPKTDLSVAPVTSIAGIRRPLDVAPPVPKTADVSVADKAIVPDMTKITITPEQQRQPMKSQLGIDVDEELGETEEERQQRERREQMAIGWSALAQGLSSLSNLYYTTKGAPDQKIGDVVSPTFNRIIEDNKRRETQQLALKQAKRQREQAQQDKEQAAQQQRELLQEKARLNADAQNKQLAQKEALIRLQNEVKLGQIDKQHAADVEKLILQGKLDEARDAKKAAVQWSIAKYKVDNSPNGGRGKSTLSDTAMDENGQWYTRTKTVSQNTMQQIVNQYGKALPREDFMIQEKEYNMVTGQYETKGKPKFDFQMAYNYLISKGMVPGATLKAIGFAPSSDGVGGQPASRKTTINMDNLSASTADEDEDEDEGAGDFLD